MASKNSIEIKTTICAVCVCIGVIVQFWPDLGFVSFAAGTLLIVVPTLFLTRFSIPIPESSSGNSKQVTSRWISIPKDKIVESFHHAICVENSVELYAEADEGMTKGCLNYFVMIPVIIICLLLSFGQPHIGALFIDLVLIPWVYLRLKLGNDYRRIYKMGKMYLTCNHSNNSFLLGKKRDNLLTVYKNTTDLNPDMQFELQHINDKTYIDDVKIVYPIPRDISGILCSMVSTAINSSVYPYSYYVLVFKGIRSKKCEIMRDLLKISNYKEFIGKVSNKDGNTVLVITKYKSDYGTREYETDDHDCMDLCDIIINLNEYLENNAYQISAMLQTPGDSVDDNDNEVVV